MSLGSFGTSFLRHIAQRFYLSKARAGRPGERLFSELMAKSLASELALREDLFDNVTVDAEKRAKFLRAPLPERRYMLFFTARSGSSRLGEMLERARVLGQPNEAFNFRFVPNIAQAYQADTLETYVDMLLRRRNTRGTYGVEITYAHMMNLFGSMDRLIEMMAPTSYIWLIRENLLAQALSLSKLIQTKVAHSTAADQTSQMAADAAFQYKPLEILHAMARYCVEEDRLEADMARFGIKPLCLSYEQTVGQPDTVILRTIADHIGVGAVDLQPAPTSHHKLLGCRSAEYAERFAQEYPDFLARMTDYRAARIERLHKF
ncbi:Stf0 family sulfotransferase [Thioclava sp. GXIMD4216]|uniref:Stf0 family sulfotransferase n=1 Tax=unclassified Thioclava TaxID=2621713 RepID=UPI0030CC536F